MAFTEDLSVFFDTTYGFAVDAVVDGVPTKLIFDEGYEEAEFVAGVNYEAQCKTADLPAAIHGDAVTAGGRTFRLTNRRADVSAIVTILDLEYVSG